MDNRDKLENNMKDVQETIGNTATFLEAAGTILGLIIALMAKKKN